jgi:hypothetical protein
VDVYFASYMENIRFRLQVSELRVYSKILEPKRDYVNRNTSILHKEWYVGEK